MKQAKKQHSEVIQSVLNEVTPLEMEQSEVRLYLAARIQELLDEKGWTNSTFASKINKNPSEITKWLSGTHNFTLDTLTEISSIFEIRLSSLFDFKNELNQSQTISIYASASGWNLKAIRQASYLSAHLIGSDQMSAHSIRERQATIHEAGGMFKWVKVERTNPFDAKTPLFQTKHFKP